MDIEAETEEQALEQLSFAKIKIQVSLKFPSKNFNLFLFLPLFCYSNITELRKVY